MTQKLRWGTEPVVHGVRRMEMTLRPFALVGGLVLVWFAGVALPAAALTFAVFPENTPAALLGNRLVSPTSNTTVFDMAVVATVRGLTTDEDGESPTYGRTEVLLEVAGVFAPTFAEFPGDRLADGMVVTSPDPGWLLGYPFVEGQGYFIPLLRTGPGGEPNYSFVCDPIAEVSDPVVAAAELGVIADHSGLDHILTKDLADAPRPPGVPPPTEDSADESDLMVRLAVLAMGLGAAPPGP